MKTRLTCSVFVLCKEVKWSIAVFLCLCVATLASAQEFPSPLENVAFITTFGQDAPSSWGDDDHVQVYFVSIPNDYPDAVYLRVFDPDIGGQFDAKMGGGFNTKCTFSVIGGAGAYSSEAGRQVDPLEGFKVGTQLVSRSFETDQNTDGKWVTLATLNPREGENDPELEAFVFKIVCEGLSGDDGNLYRFFLSTSTDENLPVPNANAFAYELCFRLKKTTDQPAHFYPFIESNVVAIRQYNFDFDQGGAIRLFSVARQAVGQIVSGDDEWKLTESKILTPEKNASIDYQIIPASNGDNDMAVYFTNQYGEAIPFFASPIGGVPQFGYKSDTQYFKQGKDEE